MSKLEEMALKAAAWDGLMANIAAEISVPDTGSTRSELVLRGGCPAGADDLAYIANVAVRIRQTLAGAGQPWVLDSMRERASAMLAEATEVGRPTSPKSDGAA